MGKVQSDTIEKKMKPRGSHRAPSRNPQPVATIKSDGRDIITASVTKYGPQDGGKNPCIIVRKGEDPAPTRTEGEATQHNIAVASISVADKLAEKLEDWWQAKGDRKTVMFDPVDSLTSKIEGELSEIADNIEGICDQFRGGLSVNIISEDD